MGTCSGAYRCADGVEPVPPGGTVRVEPDPPGDGAVIVAYGERERERERAGSAPMSARLRECRFFICVFNSSPRSFKENEFIYLIATECKPLLR
jgi:hypothetical protein